MNNTDNRDWLAEQFEGHRTHLRAVALRMLGSVNEADDAVQEAWLRLSRSDTSGVENLGGWLTTVVAHVCLDQLRARKSRREEPMESLGASLPEPIAGREDGGNPEEEAVLADSVGLALLVVLDALTPAERLAFVLHDLFDVPFNEIAPIVGRSPTAARQLASRARRRVRVGQQGQQTQEQEHEREHKQEEVKEQVQPSERETATVVHLNADQTRQRAVLNAFLTATRTGNFDGLLAVLDPDIVFHTDRAAAAAAAAAGEPAELHGAAAVARQFAGRARGAKQVLVDGAVGVTWARRGRIFVVLKFTVQGDKIVAIEAIADPERLQQLDIAELGR